jgi:hypothetical protein
MAYNPNPHVINTLYQRLGPFNSAQSLAAAALALTAALRNSMTETSLYGIPMEQALPAEHGTDTIAVLVHPHNIASALCGISKAHAHFGEELAVDPTLLVYQTFDPAGWVQLAALAPAMPVVSVQIELPPAPVIPQAPAIPAAPAIPVAPAPAPAPALDTIAAPAGVDISALVDAALSAPPITEQAAPAPQVAVETLVAPPAVAATPVQPVVAEPVSAAPAPVQRPPEVIDAQPVHAPIQQLTPEQIKGPPLDQRVLITAEGVPGPSVVTLAQAKEEAQLVVTPTGLPDPSISLGTTTPTGRTKASPFTRKVEKRNKISGAPWWWEFFKYSAPRLFAEHPAGAVDPSSTGSGPVQAYAALTRLVGEVLDGADGELTVAELRTYLREVDSAIAELDDAPAILQVADFLFGADDPGADKEDAKDA